MKPQPILAILTLCLLALPGAAVIAEAPQGDSPATEAREATEASKKASPKARVVDPVKDFGRVAKGSVLEHDYMIENRGDADLQILRVAPACGCTVAEYDKVIKPGEKGKVHAEIDTSVLGARSRRVISVYTNDPEHPMIQLTFDAQLVPHLEMHPGYARYQVVHGEEQVGIVRQWLYSLDGKDFQVTRVDSPWPFLKATYRKATGDELHAEASERAPGSVQWIIEMTLDYNEAPVGAIAEEVVVHTNHAVQDKFIVPVSGFVRPAMWATPHEVNLGRIEAGKPVRFSVVIQNFLTEPMEITGVEFDGRELSSQVSPVEDLDGRKFTVYITMEPKAAAGPLQGKVRIHTSHPKQPVLEIPLRAQIL